MARTPVTSSNIVSVGYDLTTAELEIEFKGGGLYRYADVPPGDYQQFIWSESLGRHFAAHIRGKFDCHKVVMLPALIAGEPTHGEAS